jgi:hypothetical protein
MSNLLNIIFQENFLLMISTLTLCLGIILCSRLYKLSYGTTISILNSVFLYISYSLQLAETKKYKDELIRLRSDFVDFRDRSAEILNKISANNINLQAETSKVSNNNPEFYSVLYSYADSPVGRGIIYTVCGFLVIALVCQIPVVKSSVVEPVFDTADYVGNWIYNFFRGKPDGATGGGGTNTPNLSRNSSSDSVSSSFDSVSSSFDSVSSSSDSVSSSSYGLIRDLPDDAFSEPISRGINRLGSPEITLESPPTLIDRLSPPTLVPEDRLSPSVVIPEVKKGYNPIIQKLYEEMKNENPDVLKETIETFNTIILKNE